MAPFLLHVILGIPLPLSIISILCIDLGTDLVIIKFKKKLFLNLVASYFFGLRAG